MLSNKGIVCGITVRMFLFVSLKYMDFILVIFILMGVDDKMTLEACSQLSVIFLAQSKKQALVGKKVFVFCSFWNQRRNPRTVLMLM